MDNSCEFVLERGVKVPRVRKHRAVPEGVSRAMRDYRNAYKAVYYRTSAIYYDGKWLRTDDGVGVDVKRLRQLTRQLQTRIK